MKPVKEITVKVFHPGNKHHQTQYLRAPNGKLFTPDGVEQVVQRFAAGIEEKFPYEEYSLKQIGRAEFNFVWMRKKPVDEGALLVGGMPIGQVATVEVGS